MVAISEGNLLYIIGHSNPKKYPNQKVYVLRIEDYIYLVPFVEDNEKYFLKTIYASRRMTKKYLIGDEKQWNTTN